MAQAETRAAWKWGALAGAFRSDFSDFGSWPATKVSKTEAKRVTSKQQSAPGG